jgi:hypothetical protein
VTPRAAARSTPSRPCCRAAGGPRTGRELLARAQESETTTRSQAHRELAGAGPVEVGRPGHATRRPHAVTDAGRDAFGRWVAQEPSSEQVRTPLLHDRPRRPPAAHRASPVVSVSRPPGAVAVG